MTSYAARRGTRTGATIWRVLSRETELRVVPDGVLDLMWFQDRLVVAGADTRTIIAATRPGEVTWGLRFPPGVAHALLGRPVHELTDQRIELSELVAVPGHAARSATRRPPWRRSSSRCGSGPTPTAPPCAWRHRWTARRGTG